MRTRERVFVDTGAWIALALTRDPLHPRAAETWALLHGSGAQPLRNSGLPIDRMNQGTARASVALSGRLFIPIHTEPDRRIVSERANGDQFVFCPFVS